MSPKYRGNKETWLDEQRKHGQRSKFKNTGQRDLAAEEVNATVAEVFPNQCRIRWDEGGKEVLAAYRRAMVLSKGQEGPRERAPVAVGDRVRAEKSGDTGIITGVATRRNRLVRPAPDRDDVLHVLVANLDALVVVASCKNPDFSPGLVDRFLVAASAQGIPVIIAVNKMDLWDPDQAKPWASYRDAEVETYEACAKSGSGVAELRERLIGRTVAFCGHSGVGKTSLLRVLLDSSIGQVGEVNDSTGKGRHTTTSAIMLAGRAGTAWIDTPGVREFGLLDLSPETLKDHFPEIHRAGAGCSQTSCLHRDEEGCIVKNLPRYPSYRRILESLIAGER